MNSYNYQPLDRGKREIRIFRFEPTFYNPSIPGIEIKHISLDDILHTPYRVLSGSWDTPSSSIFINLYSHLTVSENLYNALQAFNDSNPNGAPSDNWWWVDAICTNQNDPQERNEQTQLRSAILFNCVKTVAWLGPSGDDSDRAINFVHFLDSARCQPSPSSFIQQAVAEEENDMDWKALDLFLKRPAWRGVWILQNAILSRKIEFQCGKEEIVDIDVMLSAMFYIKMCMPLIRDALLRRVRVLFGKPFDALHTRLRLRDSYSPDDRLDFASTLMSAALLEAADPRDYAYATFGIARNAEDIIGEVDYTAPVVQVYAKLVESYARVYGSLDLICLSHLPRELEGLPTWVPDLSCRADHEELIVLQNIRTAGVLKATARTDSQNAEPEQDSSNAGQNSPATASSTLAAPFQSLRVSSGNAEGAALEEPAPVPGRDLAADTDQRAIFSACGPLKAAASFSDDLKILSSDGVRIGAIAGLGGYRGLTVDKRGYGALDGGHAVEQSERIPCPEVSPDEVKEAVWRSLILNALPGSMKIPPPTAGLALIADFHRANNFPPQSEFGMANPAGGDIVLQDWWHRNRELRIGEKTLEQWLLADGLSETDRRDELTEALANNEFTGVIPENLPNLVVGRYKHVTLEMGRRLFVTREGGIGMAPAAAKVGDEVWVLAGCSIPVVLRRTDEHYRFVGECFLYDFMDGNVAVEVGNGLRKLERCTII